MVDVIAAHGARTIDQAVAFLAELKKNHRYHNDVY
jgi:sulfite reductase alpha subunit-like flavoprotein